MAEAYALPNIYDEAFMQKHKMAKSYSLFSQKGYIVDIRVGSKYDSLWCLTFLTG